MCLCSETFANKMSKTLKFLFYLLPWHKTKHEIFDVVGRLKRHFIIFTVNSSGLIYIKNNKYMHNLISLNAFKNHIFSYNIVCT